MTAEHGRLVVLHRVLGVPTDDVASQLGHSARTVRQQQALFARFAARAVA